jgi:hypothetical protein
MKKHILVLLFLLFVQIVCIAQSDLYWKLGIKSGLDFQSGIATINLSDTVQTCLYPSSTSICDTKGEILFYTNGFEVFNKLDRKMPNGTNFNGGALSTPYFVGGCYPLTRSTTIIPFPKDTNKFYMFYENMEWLIEGNKYPDKFRFLVIDKSLDNGLGDVVLKDSTLLGNDTLADGSVMCLKHGNGKDYWLLVRKYWSNNFFVFLVDSNGITRKSDQKLGIQYSQNSQSQGSSASNFDNDKLSYVYVSFNSSPKIRPGQIDLYDFDRCTGLLSNYKHVLIDNVIDTLNAVSVCFSPNNRFLYVSDNYKIWQLDLSAANILQSRIMIGDRLINETYVFYEMKNGMDGKIYIVGGACRYIHVINNPDIIGSGCNFVQKQIDLGVGKYTTGGLPNEPNFSLGKIDCTIGMDEVSTAKEQLTVYPNPASQSIVISCESKVNIIVVSNVIGQQLNVKIEKLTSENCQLNTENLPSGIYFIKATDEKGNVMNAKFVKE